MAGYYGYQNGPRLPFGIGTPGGIFGGGPPIAGGFNVPGGMGGGMAPPPVGGMGMSMGRPGMGSAMSQLTARGATGGPGGGAGKALQSALSFYGGTPTNTPPHLAPVPVPGIAPPGTAYPSGPPEKGLGAILKRISTGAGKFLGGNDGYNALATVSALGDLYGSVQDRREERRRTAREEELDEEQRQRYDSWNPEREDTLRRIRSRMGG